VLDPDGSGSLADDVAGWGKAPSPAADGTAANPAADGTAVAAAPPAAEDAPAPVETGGRRIEVTFYGAASRDDQRLYLLYVLYYPADWSSSSRGPEIDHAGDVEGALLVVSRSDGRPEAVVTQAHRRFYLWLPEASAGRSLPSAASGTFGTTEDGRPLLFAESGGHGLYAFGRGRWHAPGGRRYPSGPAGVPPERLVTLTLREVRPLEEMRRFAEPSGRTFRGLEGGAVPPWTWSDARGRRGRPGAIVDDPGELYRELRTVRRR
jgi:hypothetical protein